jgi:hypothetical protein
VVRGLRPVSADDFEMTGEVRGRRFLELFDEGNVRVLYLSDVRNLAHLLVHAGETFVRESQVGDFVDTTSSTIIRLGKQWYAP